MFTGSYLDSNAASSKQTLFDFTNLLKQGGHLAVYCSCICVIFAGIYLMIRPDDFTARTTVILDTSRAALSEFSPNQQSFIDPMVIESQLEILKSYKIAGRVVDLLHLENSPEFAPQNLGLFDGQLRQRFAPAPVEEDLNTRRSRASESVLAAVKVARLGRSYLAEVAVTTKDRELSLRVANALADSYMKEQINSGVEAVENNTEWIGERVKELRDIAADAELRAQSYVQDHEEELRLRDVTALSSYNDLLTKARRAQAEFSDYQSHSQRLEQVLAQQTATGTDARVLSRASIQPADAVRRIGLTLGGAMIFGMLAGLAISGLRQAVGFR